MREKVYLVIAALAFSVFQGWGKGTYKQDEFVNLLNIEVGYKVTPNGYFFSDLGDWHGYGFNNPSKQSLVEVSEDRHSRENVIWVCNGCRIALRN